MSPHRILRPVAGLLACGCLLASLPAGAVPNPFDDHAPTVTMPDPSGIPVVGRVQGLSYGSQVLFLGKAAEIRPMGALPPGSTYSTTDAGLSRGDRGVRLDPATGALTGTPSGPSPERWITVTATRPDGSVSTSDAFSYTVQPAIASASLTGGAAPYGDDAEIGVALSLEHDARGVVIPGGGSLTLAYAGSHTAGYVSVATGASGGLLKVEYKDTHGEWKPVQTLRQGARTSFFASFLGAVVPVSGIRVTNVGSAPAEIDAFSL